MPQPQAIAGHVRLVQFQPMSEWGLWVQIDELFSGDRQGWYQIDGAKYFLEGREVAKADIVFWLASLFRLPHHPLPSIALYGNWGPYETCERAEFFMPEEQSS